MTVIAVMVVSCKSAPSAVSDPIVIGYGQASPPPVSAMPMACIYKTSGHYIDNIPVTLDASRSMIVSYPAPGDLTFPPVSLDDGYILDQRGVNGNTAFTTFTYSQYRSLPEAPSAMALFEAIIPGSRVTDIVELPMTMTEAATDTSRVNALIRGGLPGCRVLFSAPRIYLPAED